MTSILSFILTPFTFVIFVLFEQAVSLTGNYGISLVIVSFCITAGTAPLYLLADAWKNSETRLKNTMFDDIESIKNHYSGNKRFYLTKTAHRIYGYTPWQSLKTSLGLLIQIPFFFAAYEVLSHYTGYSGVSFFIVEDLAQPDGLLHGINLLPFVMTGINLVSAFYYSRSFSFKQNRSLVIMSLAFLLLLYNSPAALLIYWTMNNVFSFIKAIIFRKTGLQSIPVAILSSKKSDSVIKKMIHTYPDSIPLFFFLLFSSLSVYWIVYFKSTFTFCMLISFFASAISSFWILFIYKEKKLFAKTLIFWTCLLPLYYIFFTSRKYNPYISNVNLKLFIVFGHSLIAYILFSFITKPRLKTEVVIVGNDKSNITSFLLAVVVVFYVFFYQPLHYYLSAPQEIGIPLSAFFIRISLLSLAIFSLFIFLFVLSSISKKRKMTEIILTVFMSAILWSSVLKLKTGMLDSFTFQFENVISQISFIKFIFDPFIIVMLFIAANFILDRYSKAVSVVSSLCLIVLSLSLGLAIINTSTEKSGSFEETSSDLPATAQSNHRFSRTNTNVFFVIADMYNGNYVKKLVEHDSEYLNTLDGFVWYPDTLSVSYNTATSLPSMFGGDLFLPHILSGNDLTGSEELQIAAQSFFAAAKEKEYRITVANPMYFGPEHCSGATMENIYSYVNYWKSLNGIDSSRQDSAKAFLPIMLSLFNSAPWHLKSVIYDDSSWIIFRKSAMFIQMRNKAIKDMAYLDLLPTFAETTEGMGLFLYFHNELPHTPFGIGKDGNPIDGNFPEPNKPSFANPEAALYSAKKETDLLINFFNWMKKNNVYDNTIIVIVSDHGNPFFDSDIPKGSIPNNYFGDYDLSRAQSLLMVKGLNVRGPLVTDYATVSSADIRALLHSNKAFYPNDTFPKFPITDRKKRVYSSVAGDWEASLSRETVPFRTYSVSGPLSEKSSWSVLK